MTAPSRSLKELFLAALDVAPEDRAAWLERECAADAGVREQLRLMLAAHDAPQSLLDRPAEFPAASLPREGVGPTVDQPMAEGPGTVIGPYKLIEQIGEGGMGTVWMAQQTDPVRRLVAVKLIKAGMDSRQVLARFEAERQALALMDHPNIARVLDGGTTDAGRPYFVMNLVKGVPITKYSDEHHLTPRQRLELFAPVCQAVQHAHQKGIIHRDLKPSNVLIALYDGKPVPKVIDFGVAKAAGQSLTEKTLVTGFGNIVGTPEYMSPEQAEVNQLDIDTRSDVYSLGVLLYELLAGSPPFSRQELEKAGLLEMLRVIREQEPAKPSTKLSTADGLPTLAANRGTEPSKLTKLVRGELDWIVMKALEKDRNRRYETANGLALDLQRYLADEPVQACPPSARYRIRKFARRHRPALVLAVVVAVALVSGLVGLVIANYQIARQRNLATEQRDLAQREHEQAEVNLQKARKAVDDYFTLVSASPVLDTPGLETLRKQLLDTALAYYQDFARQHGDDASLLADVAAADLRVAQINYLSGGSSDRFFPPLRDAIDAIERLVGEGRDTPQVQQRLANIWLGGFAPTSAGGSVDDREIRQYLLKQAKIWERFCRDNPGVSEFQNDLAGVYSYLALISLSPGEKLGWSDRAIDIWQRLARENPKAASYRLDLARNYELRILLLRDDGRRPEADEYLERALALRRELARDFPERGRHGAWLAASYLTLGEAQAARNQPKEAEKALRQALDLQEKLVADFPSIPSYHQDLAKTRAAHGALLQKLGRPREAETAYRRALDIYQRLSVSSPGTTAYRNGHLLAAKSLCRLMADSGRPEEGAGVAREVVEMYEKLPDPASDSAEDLIAAAGTFESIARFQMETGQPKGAESAYRKAVETYERLPWKALVEPGRGDLLIANVRELANHLKAAGRQRDAASVYRQTIQLYTRLAAANPAEPGFRWVQAVANHELAWLLTQVGPANEAEDPYRRALELWQELAAENPAHRSSLAHVHRNFAVLHHNCGRDREAAAEHRKAKEIYETLTRESPGDPTSKFMLACTDADLGTALAGLRQPDEAERLWRQAHAAFAPLAAEFPENATYRGHWKANNDGLANHLKENGRVLEAENVLRESIGFLEDAASKNGAKPALLDALVEARTSLAHLLKDAGKLDEAGKITRAAIDTCVKMIAESPGVADYQGRVAECRYLLGQIYLEGGQGEKAVAEFDQLNPAECAGLTELLKTKGRPREAEKLCRRSLDALEKLASQPGKASFSSPLTAGYISLARLLHANNQNAEAEGVYERGRRYLEARQAQFPVQTEFRHELGRIHNHLGLLLASTGRGPEAEAAHRRAADLFEDLARAKLTPERERWRRQELMWTRENLGLLALNTGRHKDGEKAFRQAIDLGEQLNREFPDQGYVGWTARQYGGLAALLSADGRPLDALKAYQKALELAPRSAAAHNNLAWLLATSPDPKARNPERAVESAKAAVELAPGAGEYRNTLGAAHYRAGNWKDSVTALLESVQLRDGGDSFDWYFLAMAHARLGKTELAGKWYGFAVRWMAAKDPKNQELLRFRAEAGEVLGTGAGAADSPPPAAPGPLDIHSLILETDPAATRARARRGELYALAKDWVGARSDYARAAESGSDDVSGVWYPLALLDLRTGRTGDYRALSEDLLKRCEQTKDPGTAFWTIITCKLAPDAVRDRARLVRLAEKHLASDPGNAHAIGLLGDALYRAGEPRAAAEKLEAGIRGDPGIGRNWRKLFLSMAYHRLGRTAEAAKSFREVEGWMGTKEYDQLPWTQRLDLELLRQEAQQTLGLQGKQN